MIYALNKWCSAAAASLCLFTLSHAAVAQEGFALNRFEPAEPGSDWFAGESLDFRSSPRPALGVVFDWAHRPLVLYDANGDEIEAIVADQFFAHLGANLTVWDRVRLGINLPLLLVHEGAPGVASGTVLPEDDGPNIGDLRLSLDARLLGEYGGLANLAVGLQAFVPTGSESAFASDGKLRLRPRVMLAGEASQFVYAAQAGLNIRQRGENFGGSAFGNEVLFTGSAGVRFAPVLIGAEVFGSTVVSDSGDGLFKRTTTPFEIIAVGKYAMGSDWQAGLGVGPGLTRGLGSPSLRVLASIEWHPGVVVEKDSDGDAILDRDDACPTVAGEANPDRTKNGCPAPKDHDQDGISDSTDACPDHKGPVRKDPSDTGCPDTDADRILDKRDACPTEAGIESSDPALHGCPLRDRDQDGIVDADDACPDQVGIPNPNKELNGCPDTDGDGIADQEDACPTRPGDADLVNKAKHGCPKAIIEKGQIVILERVEFETGKAVLRPDSEPVLRSVHKLLAGDSKIEKLRVEGHTDDRGGKALNKKLSQARAEAVATWLVEHGIEKSRLVSQGFGSEKPIETNSTEAGRQNNRRVEFHIVDNAAKQGSK